MGVEGTTSAGGGVADERLPEDMQLSTPLTEEEARALARWAVKLEEHFGATGA